MCKRNLEKCVKKLHLHGGNMLQHTLYNATHTARQDAKTLMCMSHVTPIRNKLLHVATQTFNLAIMADWTHIFRHIHNATHCNTLQHTATHCNTL